MKAARRRINSGPTKNFFRLRTHNDNIIQSELLIVNVTGHMCTVCKCIMRHDGRRYCMRRGNCNGA